MTTIQAATGHLCQLSHSGHLQKTPKFSIISQNFQNFVAVWALALPCLSEKSDCFTCFSACIAHFPPHYITSPLCTSGHDERRELDQWKQVCPVVNGSIFSSAVCPAENESAFSTVHPAEYRDTSAPRHVAARLSFWSTILTPPKRPMRARHVTSAKK